MGTPKKVPLILGNPYFSQTQMQRLAYKACAGPAVPLATRRLRLGSSKPAGLAVQLAVQLAVPLAVLLAVLLVVLPVGPLAAHAALSWARAPLEGHAGRAEHVVQHAERHAGQPAARHAELPAELHAELPVEQLVVQPAAPAAEPHAAQPAEQAAGSPAAPAVHVVLVAHAAPAAPVAPVEQPVVRAVHISAWGRCSADAASHRCTTALPLACRSAT